MKKNNLFKSKNFIIIDTSYVIWSYDDHFIGNDFFDQNEDPNPEKISEYCKKVRKEDFENFSAQLIKKVQDFKSSLGMGKEEIKIFYLDTWLYWKLDFEDDSPEEDKKVEIYWDLESLMKSLLKEFKENIDYHQVSIAVGWEITDSTVNSGKHPSLEHFLKQLSLENNDLHYFRSKFHEMADELDQEIEDQQFRSIDYYYGNINDRCIYEAIERGDSWLDEEAQNTNLLR